MTVSEYQIALEGYLKSKGIKPDDEKLMTKNEYLEIMAKHG